MINGQHHDSLGFINEMNRVGKTLHNRTSYSPADAPENEWCVSNRCQRGVHRILEFQPKPGPLTLIPRYRFVVFVPGYPPEHDFTVHGF